MKSSAVGCICTKFGLPARSCLGRYRYPGVGELRQCSTENNPREGVVVEQGVWAYPLASVKAWDGCGTLAIPTNNQVIIERWFRWLLLALSIAVLKA